MNVKPNCPHCDSPYVNGISLWQEDYETVVSDVVCTDCNKQFQMIFTLSSIQVVK